MILRIIYDKNEYYDYDLGEIDNTRSRVLTGVYPICEITVLYLHNAEEMAARFEKVAKEIQSKPFILAEEVQLLDDNKHLCFKQTRKIKDVCYRDIFYSSGHNLVKEELLTIKFQEGCKAILDVKKEQIFCDKENCMYFEKGYCSNYNTNLYKSNEDYIPCFPCFLECSPGFRFSEIYKFYTELTNKANKEGHLPYQPYTIRNN